MKRLGRVYARWLDSLARALVRRRTGARTWSTLLLNTPAGLEVHAGAPGSSKHLGTIGREPALEEIATLRSRILGQPSSISKSVLIRLSPADVVERTIQIPAAASDVIEPVIKNQLERLVPWPQDDTSYGYRVLASNGAAKDQLEIAVAATTRKVLDAAIERARSVGLSPHAVDFAPGGEANSSIELMSLEADPVKKVASGLNTFLMLTLAATVAVGGFGLYQVWGRELENSDLEARIETIKVRVDEIRRLNKESLELKQQRERLVRRKLDEPAVILSIEALSRVLPDSAYLTEIEIHGKEARIVGKSNDPTALITKLEDSAQFGDVHFSAPTTQEQGEAVGTFTIVAETEGGSNLEPRP